MMACSEDQVVLAAEYVLGTLNADERRQVEAMMAVDRDFTAMVRAWEHRLGALNQMVGLVEPRPVLWELIQSAVGQPQAPLVLPEPPPPGAPLVEEAPPAQAEPAEALPVDASETVAPVVDNADATRLSGQARRWRAIAAAVTAAAAVLVVLVGTQILQPDLLPELLRPKPRTRVVEVKAPPAAPVPSAQYVAVLQAQGGAPAFILTVDGATRSFTVRKVGTEATEPGKSYELWLISDKLPRPRSLGVIGAGDFTTRAVLAAYDGNVVINATYAVTVEQAGGSPDGAPHSDPVYSGKLIETVPAQAQK